MPQLSLYLDDAAMADLRESSAAEHLSLSSYARKLIRNHSDSAWPAGFWGLYGMLEDESFTLSGELDASLDGPLPAFD